LGSSTIFSVSPTFNLPVGSLSINWIDIRSISNPIVAGAGMLLAGLQMAGTGTTAPTDPTQLESLLPGDDSNLYLKVQDSVANALIQVALQTGQLTALAQQQQSNAFIDSASATFQNNRFVAQIGGYLYHECPLNVNLYFTDTRTISFQLDGASIEINQSDDTSITQVQNFMCLLTTLGLAALAAVGGAVFGAWLGGLVGTLAEAIGGWTGGIGGGIVGFLLSHDGNLAFNQIVSGQAGGGKPNSTIVNLTQPIPDSNFLPTLSGGYFQISNGGLLIGAVAATQPDTINTIIYVRFLVPAGGIEVTATTPLSGVTVELMAQNVPPPPGASQVPPSSSTGLGIHRVTVTYTYEPPISDLQLAVGQTDYTGEVRFGLLASQLATPAGTIKEVRTAFNPDADRVVSTTSLTTVIEANPDLYFRVTMANGSVVDTRQLPGGLMTSFVSSQVGTLEYPLTFTFGGVATGTQHA
jgi:hypothetical protein